MNANVMRGTSYEMSRFGGWLCHQFVPPYQGPPKAMLDVAGKTILERLLEKIGDVDGIDHVNLVTNSRFVRAFEEWVADYEYGKPVSVIDDGTTSNEDRRGAIGDVQIVIDRAGIADDLMILAGDNLFELLRAILSVLSMAT